MTVKFTNNASSTLASAINTTATSLTVADASTFPSLSGADDYCYLTIQQATGTVREVVKATARSGNNFTIQRAFDNTTARAFSASDIVELRMTAALLQDVIDQATVEGIKTNYQFVPTAGQTQFSGADNSGDTLIINDAELVNVYMNGVRLVQGSDYTVSSSNNRVTLTTGATTADIIDIEVFGNFTGQSGAAVGITGGAISGTAITTGSINNTPIGATQANTVAATTLTANSLTTTGTATFGSHTRVNGDFSVSAASGEDRFAILPQTAGSGSILFSGNAALTAYEPLVVDFETLALRTSGTPRLSISASGNATFSGTITSGPITVNTQDATNEGGEIVLKGAGSNENINIDNHASIFRIFDPSSPTVRLSLNTDGDATFAGKVDATELRVGNLVNNGTISADAASGKQAITAKVQNNGNSLFQGFNASSQLITQITGSGAFTHNGTATFSGNVGIGTGVTAPEETLSVMGGFQVALNTSVTGRGLKVSTSNSSITDDLVTLNAQASTGILAFQTNDADRLVITASGDVVLGEDASTTTVAKGFSTGHASANRAKNVRYGMTDSTFTGMQIVNAAAANSSYNAQSIEFITHEGAISVGTRMKIDSLGNILFGTSTTAAGNEGVVYFNGNSLRITRDSNEPLVLDRLTNQGKLVEFRQAGTTRGLIGTVANDLFICSTGSGHNGLRFHANGILPTDDNGDLVDGNADLGDPSYRYRNLYLSAAAFADNYQFAQNSAAGSATEAIYRNTTGQITIRAGSEDLVRVDGANDIISLGGLPAGSVMTHGVIASNKAKTTLGTSLGDTMRVFAVHGQTANSDFLTFGSRRITAGQSGWNHSVWDITRDVDNTSNLYRYMTFGIAETVINDHGDTTMNFRVETSSNESALKVHASSGAITVGQNHTSVTSDGWYWGGLHSTHRHYVGAHTHATSANALLYLNRHNASGGVQIEFRTNNGPVGTISTTSSGTFYATTSDRRLKEDIAPVSGATALLEKMNPVSFKWIAKPEGDYEFGFIAQEMVEVMPEAVVGSEDEMTAADGPDGEVKQVYMQMDYGRITPIIVAALQEANKEIAALKARIQALEEEA